MSTDDMQKYGESYISELSKHYGIDDCSAQQEWVDFRLVMKNMWSSQNNMQTIDVLRMLYSTKENLPNTISNFE